MRRTYNRFQTWITVILFFCGIILTVSSGRWFPFLNMVGISLIVLSSFLTLALIEKKPGN
jgi:ABC-type multidrug transport system permease subunit